MILHMALFYPDLQSKGSPVKVHAFKENATPLDSFLPLNWKTACNLQKTIRRHTLTTLKPGLLCKKYKAKITI